MSKIDIYNSARAEDWVKSTHSKWTRFPKDVIPLWIASPDFPIAPEIKNAIITAVNNDDVSYSSDSDTKQLIAEKIQKFNNIPVTPEDIMIIQGVDPGLWLTIHGNCSVGDEIIVNDPMYGTFRRVAEDVKAKVVYWPLEFEENYKFDTEKLKNIITKKTKLISICNPHNPTGRVMTKDELKSIADLAVDHKIKLVVDELWEDIRFDEKKHLSIASINPEVSELSTTSWGCSKTFGVAGLQIGYLCTTNKSTLNIYKKLSSGIQRGTTSLSRAAANVMLSEKLDWWRINMVKHLTKIKELVIKRMNEIPGIDFRDFEGTYVPFCKFNYDMNSREMSNYLLKEAKVAISAGSGFGSRGETFQRINIATSTNIMNEAIDRIENALQKLKPL
ncbi:pyridoxal phosphate-dependent aminotransferase [Candidatus Bathyarchaeota archaeon]|nr:pyridoxal phosphate-dependent aminotransferase [Candidatus Bathyarchaeota archaeon]